MRAVILDTGVANLSSLAFAVKRLGVEPIITREAAEIRAADRIFLPGVGTARAAMAAIEERGLADLIREATQPVLGICLGEQILGRRSEETGGVDLLGLIDADVRALRADGLPLPHMGWNRVYPEDTPHARLLFRGIGPATGSTSCTATQCPRAPARPPAARTARSSRQLRHTKTSWACSSIRNAPAAPAHA